MRYLTPVRLEASDEPSSAACGYVRPPLANAFLRYDVCQAAPGAQLRICASRTAPSLQSCEAAQTITYRANLSSTAFALSRVTDAADRSTVLVCHRGSGVLEAEPVLGPARPVFPAGNVVAVDVLEGDRLRLRTLPAAFDGYANTLVF